jgi:hypothetical protein
MPVAVRAVSDQLALTISQAIQREMAGMGAGGFLWMT